MQFPDGFAYLMISSNRYLTYSAKIKLMHERYSIGVLTLKMENGHNIGDLFHGMNLDFNLMSNCTVQELIEI